MKQDIYTNIHFNDHSHVNIDSKQSVIKEHPSSVPRIYSLIYYSFGLSTATIDYSCLSVWQSAACLCVCVSLCKITQTLIWFSLLKTSTYCSI